MQWYEMKKAHVSTGLFQRAQKWNNPRTTLFVQKMFSNLHDYRISRIFFVHCTKWENSDFTPCRTPMTRFFWTPHAVPRKPKNFRKIVGYLWIWSAPGRLFRVKIQPMQLPPCHVVHGFSHMIVIYLLTCWKMFQLALLKACFHNMATTTLIEHARTFLYMTTPTYIGSCAPVPCVQVCCLSSWNWNKPHQKKDGQTVHTCIFY